MDINKKSVLFTLGLVLITFTLLSFSILIYRNNVYYNDDKFLISILMDTLYDSDSSIQDSLRELFGSESGVNVSLSNNSVSFYENLPNTKAAVFNPLLDRFKAYVESNFSSNYSSIILNIDELKNNLPMTVNPYGVVYKHLLYGNDIFVDGNENLKGAVITIIIPDTNISCNWPSPTGNFNLTINAYGFSSTSCAQSIQLDPSISNQFDIKKKETGNLIAYVNLTNYDIMINSTRPAKINTTLVFNDSAFYIESLEDVINIGFDI